MTEEPAFTALTTQPKADTHVVSSGTGYPVQNCYATDVTTKQWQKAVSAYIDKDDTGNYARITL